MTRENSIATSATKGTFRKIAHDNGLALLILFFTIYRKSVVCLSWLLGIHHLVQQSWRVREWGGDQTQQRYFEMKQFSFCLGLYHWALHRILSSERGFLGWKYFPVLHPLIILWDSKMLPWFSGGVTFFLNICRSWTRHGMQAVLSEAASLAVVCRCEGSSRLDLCFVSGSTGVKQGLSWIVWSKWALYTVFLLFSDCAQNLESYANSANKVKNAIKIGEFSVLNNLILQARKPLV